MAIYLVIIITEVNLSSQRSTAGRGDLPGIYHHRGRLQDAAIYLVIIITEVDCRSWQFTWYLSSQRSTAGCGDLPGIYHHRGQLQDAAIYLVIIITEVTAARSIVKIVCYIVTIVSTEFPSVSIIKTETELGG